MPARPPRPRHVAGDRPPPPAPRPAGEAMVGALVRRIVAMEENELRLLGLEGLRRTFISEASHELNTPLTPLTIHAEALAELPDLPPEQRMHAEVILRNVRRLGRLVRGMLDASRLETGRFRLDLADVPLLPLLAESARTHQEAAALAGVRLSVGRCEGLVARADRERVGQVLENLVGNALRYTPPGGRVTVEAHEEGGMAVVRVRDTGVGLTPPQVGQLFQPFSRPNAGPPGTGTGLGLFIAKGIVEQMGGRIWAESAGRDRGSAFCFSLPLAPLDAAPAPLEAG